MLKDSRVSSMMRARALSSAGENEPPSVARPRIDRSGLRQWARSVVGVRRSSGFGGWLTVGSAGSEGEGGPRITGSTDVRGLTRGVAARAARTRNAYLGMRNLGVA